MLSARGGIAWAVQEHVLDGFKRLAAWAGDLFLGVTGVETFGCTPR